MVASILQSTKKLLGLAPDYTAFDDDVIMYINGAFSNLHQLGIGPADGFMIEDAEPVWDDYLADDSRYNAVRNYVGLKARLGFDPPTTSFGLDALKDQIAELEWRLNVVREGDIHNQTSSGGVIDGGTP